MKNSHRNSYVTLFTFVANAGQKHTFISCQFNKCSFNLYVLIFAWVLGCKFPHQDEFWSPHSSKKNVFIDLHFIHYVTNLTRNKRRSRKPHHHFHLPILCFILQRFPLNTYHSFLISFGTLWMNLKFVQNTFILNILTYQFGQLPVLSFT